MNQDAASPSASSASSSATAAVPTPSPVATVSIKIPPFWPNDPQVWFAQVEAQFTTRNITSQQTKFAHVIASLQPEVAQEIRDLLINPPTDQPYDKLKSELIKRTSASEQKRLHQLLISEELGDRKPSQLLRRMRQLLGDNNLEDRILRQLFLQRLPMNAQLILASSADTVSIDQLATLADKILEVALPTPSVASITPGPLSSTHADPVKVISDLQGQINSLATQIQALTNQFQSQPRFRGRSQSRSPGNRSSSFSRSPNRQNQNHPFCWYHWKYGSNARHCNPPCTFNSANPPTTNTSTQNQENSQASD